MRGDRSTFRDFGILPDGLPAPAQTVRAFFSTGRTAGQYLATILVASVGLGFVALFVALMPWSLALLASTAAALTFGAIVHLATHNDYRWIELDGTTLRAKHLYTGRVVERQVRDIESLGTMVLAVRNTAVVVVEGFLGRVKGIEIRFRDGRTPFRVMRADPAMTNAEALIKAVIYRMNEIAELDAELVTFVGKPLVRRIGWKGESPKPRPNPGFKIMLGCGMGIAFLFGTILAFLGSQQQAQFEIFSVPPHDIALRDLIEHGPGPNRHVTLTQYRPGGYAFESGSGSGSWTQVWLALFPADPASRANKQIQVVLSAHGISNETALQGLVQSGRVEAICSKSTRAHWGTQLGPQIEGANPGCQLSSPWDVEALTEIPTVEQAKKSLMVANLCLGAAILLAAGLFLKAR